MFHSIDRLLRIALLSALFIHSASALTSLKLSASQSNLVLDDKLEITIQLR